MDIDEAVEYLRERRNDEYAEESTDWSLCEAIDAVLGCYNRNNQQQERNPTHG